MRIHILGTGCPVPAPEAYGSAFVLETDGDWLMVDCGPASTYKMARMGISPLRISHVFLTHHHFDHNVDFPCFALTRWDMSKGTEPPLKVYGPPPTRVFVERLLGKDGAFLNDWQSRITHPASQRCYTQRGGILPRPPPAIEASDVGPGKIAEAGSWVATAVRVHHVEPGLESLAYRFETTQGSIVFAGDCGDCPELRNLARKAHSLVIACTHFGKTDFEASIADVITGTSEVAAIANAAGVLRVILTHVSPNFHKPGVREKAIAEIARSYCGAIYFPNELTTVELS